MKRTFAIGDIHGHLEALDRVLVQLQNAAQPGDTLVFLGDYIDRGPDSKGVVTRVMELRDGAWDGPVIPLLGNHEDMLLDHCRGVLPRGRLYDLGIWESNGGDTTVKSYMGQKDFDLLKHHFPSCNQRERAFLAATLDGINDIIPEDHLEFFTHCLLHYEDPYAYYVHAGFRPGKLPRECSRNEWLWIREEFLYSPYEWDKPVVFGHTPQMRGPMNKPGRIGIDTGVYRGGCLTAVQFPERVFYTSKTQSQRLLEQAGAG